MILGGLLTLVTAYLGYKYYILLILLYITININKVNFRVFLIVFISSNCLLRVDSYIINTAILYI